ncbi:MAG: polynucleotide adenylyltransferase PcnB [Vicinamibacterales bacterium]
MAEPLIVPRAEHSLSRRDVDPDALKVLYRLTQLEYRAYLVGGSVRDLLLGRRPKDFDIGTDAHPYQIKKAFRNCWIVGRRFRLAHVKFGTKTIEVATFRKSVPATDFLGGDSPVEPVANEPLAAPPDDASSSSSAEESASDKLIRRDNTFGTPEEDAFRRDFTINALFYDISTFSIIDYVGGLDDLRRQRIRCIGDPDERFQEDPVRMLRAVVLAARLDFDIDAPIYEAIERHRGQIARAAPARLLEEYYKILRSGAAEAAFEALARVRLLDHLSPELKKGAELHPRVRTSLASLDRYRRQFAEIPESLRNSILLGSLIAPLGRGTPRRPRAGQEAAAPLPATEARTLGVLPLARRDMERFGQILGLQRRLAEVDVPARAQRALVHRASFPEAITWLRIHGTDRDLATFWESRYAELMAPQATSDDADRPRRRRRRRRRRRPRADGPPERE